MALRSFHSLRGTLIKSLKNPSKTLKSILADQILSQGPISFSSYMSTCLTHPEFGYYNRKEIFGKTGDFITSPEISQMFGECLGIWCGTLHEKLKPAKWHIVEIGPGKGTLAVDILRTVKKLKCDNGLSLHFIDASVELKKVQQESLLRACNGQMQFERFKGVDRYFDKDISAYWYSTLNEMTQSYLQNYLSQPVVLIGHEIFDALPINIFEFHETLGWCERLIDTNSHGGFEITLSNGANENVKTILKPEKLFKSGVIKDLQHGNTIEISKEGIKLMQDICELIKLSTSACLLIDYGEEHAFADSIRGIKKHEKIPKEEWLQAPGEVDLSAYVDFAALKAVVSTYKELQSAEIMPQGCFLEAMGISARLEMLAMKNPSKAKNLQQDYERLASPTHMGEIYKCLYASHTSLSEMFPFSADLTYEKNN